LSFSQVANLRTICSFGRTVNNQGAEREEFSRWAAESQSGLYPTSKHYVGSSCPIPAPATWVEVCQGEIGYAAWPSYA